MESTAEIQCPFCGQWFGVVVETTLPSRRFTIDCEVCCRPLEVTLECEAGEIISLQAEGG